MIVSKTVSIHLEDLSEIMEKIREGKYTNLSEFVQTAIKNELYR